MAHDVDCHDSTAVVLVTLETVRRYGGAQLVATLVTDTEVYDAKPLEAVTVTPYVPLQRFERSSVVAPLLHRYV